MESRGSLKRFGKAALVSIVLATASYEAHAFSKPVTGNYDSIMMLRNRQITSFTGNQQVGISTRNFPDLKRRSVPDRMISMEAEPLVIGMFGAGTVGGGIYEILEKKAELFGSLDADIKIKTICVKSLDKPRDFLIKEGIEVVTDFDAILNDPEINCVVEVMGGVTAAKDVVFSAIEKNKHVMTANKALIAQFLPEIEEKLKANPQVKFGYEAAVCGGIPIIHALQQDYLGDTITKILGIMNGTTNFMLTKMESEGADYDEVLKEAQDLGYAEADPTADVEGLDVQAKIAIVAKLAFGMNVPVEAIPCDGISKISSIDFGYAKEMGCTIKLAGCAQLSENKDALSVYVSPVVCPTTHPLASARMATNLVEILSDNQVSSSFVGPGAGRFPTANSVVNDIVRAARGLSGKPFPLMQPEKMKLDSNFTSKFYVRCKVHDGLGITRVAGELAEKYGISIDSILQHHIEDPANVDFVITTGETSVKAVQSFVDDFSKYEFSLEKPLVMTLL